jgi:maleate isomerase
MTESRHAPSPAEVVAGFEQILLELLAGTDATRTTVRLDVAALRFHVDDVVAEARQPGLASLKGVTSIDQRAAPSVRFLERERRILVQDDCAAATDAPPPELLRLYGVRAQMLGPVIRDGALTGWFSVHETRGPRAWRPGDIAALEHAIARAHALLDRAGA